VRGIHEPPKYDEYKQWRFNCFAKNDWEYTDEKYGLCKTYVECRQKDALKINVLGTEEVVREWDLTPGNEIYAKFQDAYNKEKSMCTEDDIDLSATEKKCTVKFECKDNGNKEVMKSLAEEFSKLQDSGITKEETVTIDRGQCELRGDCFEDANRIYRSVPKILNMVAHSVPENPESKFGTEVASIKATVECEKEESLLDRICDALGGIISAGELVEKFSKPLEVAGVVTEIGCGIISELGG
jgi:hypothetical protein